MSANERDELLIRRYLVSEVTEDELADIEQRIMSDDAFFDEVRAVSDEMTDLYVSNRLSKDERKRFEERFLSTIEGRRQVAFARPFQQYVGSNTGDHVSTGSGNPFLVGRFFRGMPGYLRVAVSLTVIAAAGFAVWRTFIYDSDIQKGTQALRAAYASSRPT